MRALAFLAASLLLLTLAPAEAHTTHGGCTTSRTHHDYVIHVDTYSGNCDGAYVYGEYLLCGNDGDGHFDSLWFHLFHLLVADGPDCDTGILIP